VAQTVTSSNTAWLTFANDESLEAIPTAAP
ncbi:uncharacterized protein METZ01_LOCUS297293, partial [marine metagenome]